MTEAEYIAILEACRDWLGISPDSLDQFDQVCEVRMKVVTAINAFKGEEE